MHGSAWRKRLAPIVAVQRERLDVVIQCGIREEEVSVTELPPHEPPRIFLFLQERGGGPRLIAPHAPFPAYICHWERWGTRPEIVETVGTRHEGEGLIGPM